MRKTTILIPVLFVRPGAFPVPGAGQVSMPESVFGFKPGADMKLLTWDQTACFALISDRSIWTGSIVFARSPGAWFIPRG